MTEEQKRALKSLVDAWTDGKTREDAINEVRMAFLAGDALEHIAMLEIHRGALEQENARLANQHIADLKLLTTMTMERGDATTIFNCTNCGRKVAVTEVTCPSCVAHGKG